MTYGHNSIEPDKAVKKPSPLPARRALSVAIMCLQDALNTYGFDRDIAGALATVRALRDDSPHEPVVQDGRRRRQRKEPTPTPVEDAVQLPLS